MDTMPIPFFLEYNVEVSRKVSSGGQRITQLLTHIPASRVRP